MRRIILVVCCVAAASLLASSSASARGGIDCGRTTATDNSGNTARFSVKSYDVGCNRSDKTLQTFWDAVDGEQGTQKKIKGFICGPLQKYSVGSLAFQCRSKKGGAKRFKAHWVSLTKS
jgi:hypothetical protein